MIGSGPDISNKCPSATTLIGSVKLTAAVLVGTLMSRRITYTRSRLGYKVSRVKRANPTNAPTNIDMMMNPANG
jgi:hypothetical protein